jgi:hypothetical protein
LVALKEESKNQFEVEVVLEWHLLTIINLIF